MANNRKLPRIEDQGASFKSDGYFAAFDWRYELLVDYLKLSPTYQAICKSKGKAIKAVPKDCAKIVKVYSDFKDVFVIRESDWWARVGMPLFGLKARQSEAFIVTQETKSEFLDTQAINTSRSYWSDMAKPDSLVLAIPRNQTKQQALKQVTAIIRAMNFVSPKELVTKPRYQLLRSKLQKDTVVLGVDALKMYRRGIPLWQIGYRLGLSPDSCADIDLNKDVGYNKQYLSIAASKLIHKAENIAENAARGIFPSDKPLKAGIARVARKVGRPRKVK